MPLIAVGITSRRVVPWPAFAASGNSAQCRPSHSVGSQGFVGLFFTKFPWPPLDSGYKDLCLRFHVPLTPLPLLCPPSWLIYSQPFDTTHKLPAHNHKMSQRFFERPHSNRITVSRIRRFLQFTANLAILSGTLRENGTLVDSKLKTSTFSPGRTMGCPGGSSSRGM